MQVPLSEGLNIKEEEKPDGVVPLSYGLGVVVDDKLSPKPEMSPKIQGTEEARGTKELPLSFGLKIKREEKEPEDLPFAAKYPTAYGAYGAVKETGKALIPYIKYIDPDERERFMKLSKQKQVRELLLQDLETVALVGAKPLTEGVKAVAKHKVAPFLAKHFPKTLATLQKTGQALTKPLGKGGEAVAKVAEPTMKETVAPEIEELTRFIKETAIPKRAEQEAIYTKIRGERIKEVQKVVTKGEAGYYEKVSKLKGKMDQVDFHTIKGKFTQEKTNRLFNIIGEYGGLDDFEKITAGRGLAKIFGELGGAVPQPKELEFLTKVFGEDFTKAILSKRDLFTKAKEVGLEVANIPRSLMASYDLSAPLRQGIFLIGRPKQWAPAFRDMFKYFVSEKSFAALGEEIAARPTYKLMKEARLALTELGSKMTAREEDFMSSYASKIPIIGKGVRWSERAYTGFLNKLRADVFDDMVKKATDLGVDVNRKFLTDAANYINHATGRGTLPFGLEKVAVPLNAAFFSPRLVMSRLNLLNPVFYAKLHPQVRKEALTDLFKFGAIASTVVGLAAAGGADVGLDPRSADFMKIKFGNKRYDPLGGFQQPIRAAAQVISGEVVSSTTGKVMTLGEGYRGLTRTEIITRFAESKEAPLMSLATALLRGKTGTGELVDVPTEVANRFIPMVLQDMKDFYEEEGVKGIPMALPAMFGVGAMSYGGVQSYGLNGKDHPKLNDELNRLKTSMGYPSTVAFGQELDIKEYKLLKEKTGNEIAKVLTENMNAPYWKDLNDRFKVQRIEQLVDQTKDRVKFETFPDKEYETSIKKSFMATEGYTEEEAKQAAKDFIKKRK